MLCCSIRYTVLAVVVMAICSYGVNYSDSGWTHSAVITLNTTSTGANVQGPVHNFPVLVRLNANNFIFSQSLTPGGGDMRFVKSNGAALSFEIALWSDAPGTANDNAEIWVKCDTVYGNSSNQNITMYWGKSGATSTSNSKVVFDTAYGFQAVWHLNEATNEPAHDATINGYNGTAGGVAMPADTIGIIGRAKVFNGLSGHYKITGSSSGKLNFPLNGMYTVSAWINSLEFSKVQSVVTKSDYQYVLQIVEGGEVRFVEYDNATGWQKVVGPVVADVWYQAVGVRNGTQEYLYLNGIVVDSTIESLMGMARDETKEVCIGATEGTSRFFNGKIDDIQMANVSRSADWIKLSYENQKLHQSLVKVVFPSPVISVEPSALEKNIFLTPLATDTVIIWNGGAGTINYSCSLKHASPWLTITTASGSSTGEFDTIICSYDTTYHVPGNIVGRQCGFYYNCDSVNMPYILGGDTLWWANEYVCDSLCVENYADTIVVTAVGALNTPREIPVTFKHTDPSTVSVRNNRSIRSLHRVPGKEMNISIFSLNGKKVRTVVAGNGIHDQRTMQSVCRGIPAGIYIILQKDNVGTMKQQIYKYIKW